MVFYNIVIQFGIHIKLVRQRYCQSETYGRIKFIKNLSDMIPVKNVLKQGDALWPFFLTFFKVRHYKRLGKTKWIETNCYT